MIQSSKPNQLKCKSLADEIRKIFDKGIIVGRDAIHYIDSTFFNPTVAELQALLQEDFSCETDSLMELLFFPDESMQLQLEATLERLQLREQDEVDVLAYLLQQPLKVTIRFGDEREHLSITASETALTQLLSRLSISKHLNRRVIEDINHYVEERHRERFKVRMRNSRFLPTPNKIQFLRDFFKHMGNQSHDVLDCLDFVLGFLEELKEDTDMYAALTAKKRFYFDGLQKAKKLDTQLRRNNIETLLLQGKRVVLIDQADARKKMLMIDRISRAVFGRTEYFEPTHDEEKQIEFHSGQDIRDIISTLA